MQPLERWFDPCVLARHAAAPRGRGGCLIVRVCIKAFAARVRSQSDFDDRTFAAGSAPLGTAPIVIILGSARSGTTWLGKLFDSHPDVAYRHEPDSVDINTVIPFLPRKSEAGEYVDLARGYLDNLKCARYPKSVGHRPFFKKSFRPRHARYGLVASSMALKALEGCVGRRASRLSIPRAFDTPSGRAVHFVVKSVSSLCRAYLFSLADPGARIVHVVRHPCAVVASRMRGVSQGLLDPTVFLDAVLRMEEAARYPLSREDLVSASYEEQLAYQWMIQNDKVLAEMNGSSRYKVVIYEDLCKDVRAGTREAFAFADLEWDAQTERFIERLETSRRRAAGYFSVMRSPMSATTTWRDELREEQIARIRAICAHARIQEVGLRL
jgi:Sulfotransferase family